MSEGSPLAGEVWVALGVPVRHQPAVSPQDILLFAKVHNLVHYPHPVFPHLHQ